MILGPLRRCYWATAQSNDFYELAAEVGLLQASAVSSEVTSDAMTKFRDLFGTRSGPGTELVVQHVHGLEDPDFIAASSEALTHDLLDEIS